MTIRRQYFKSAANRESTRLERNQAQRDKRKQQRLKLERELKSQSKRTDLIDKLSKSLAAKV